jgi:hypothetical protein
MCFMCNQIYLNVLSHKYYIKKGKNMVDLKINIPEKLYEEMKKHKKINWNSIAKRALKQKIKEIEEINLIKEFKNAEKEYKEGKCIPFEEMLEELGLE